MFVLFIILGVASLAGMLVQNKLKAVYSKYAGLRTHSGMTGREVAIAMMQHYGISDVAITQGKGMLTDHYNPLTKTVTLSPAVYQGNSIMSAAIAAHECGHVVQHATAYPALKFRSAIVPLVKMAAGLQQFLLIFALGSFGFSQGGSGISQMIGLALLIAFGVTALFSLVTLPVEFDASNRALAWLENTGIVQESEFDGAKEALKWAALTYVVSALAALVTFLYFLRNFLGKND